MLTGPFKRRGDTDAIENGNGQVVLWVRGLGPRYDRGCDSAEIELAAQKIIRMLNNYDNLVAVLTETAHLPINEEDSARDEQFDLVIDVKDAALDALIAAGE